MAHHADARSVGIGRKTFAGLFDSPEHAVVGHALVGERDHAVSEEHNAVSFACHVAKQPLVGDKVIAAFSHARDKVDKRERVGDVLRTEKVELIMGEKVSFYAVKNYGDRTV